MIYRNRSLRRLWQIKRFIPRQDGMPHDQDSQITTETLIAWNRVDAIRRAQGEVSEPPKPLCFVTWDDPPREIYDTSGPTDKVVEPTIEMTDW